MRRRRVELHPCFQRPFALLTAAAGRLQALSRLAGSTWPSIEVISTTSIDALRALLEGRETTTHLTPQAVLLDLLIAGTPTVRATRAMLDGRRPTPAGWFAVPIIAIVPDVGAAMSAIRDGALDCVLPTDTAARCALTFALAWHDPAVAAPRLGAQATDGSGPAVMVREGRHTRRVPLRGVRLVEAEGNYVRLVTAGERHLLRATIGDMAVRLSQLGFLRVHRSTLVNLEFVREVQANRRGDAFVILSCGHRVRVSKRLRAVLSHTFAKGVAESWS